MTTIANAYINALFADAAYVNLTLGASEADLKRDLGERMTPTQAAYLAANFEIASTVNESDNPLAGGSGFDATVWRGKADTEYAGQTYVSMRGTQPQDGGSDLVADADLASSGVAHSQLRDMVNWWLRATTPIGQTVKQIATREISSGGPIALVDFVAATSLAGGTGELVGVANITAVNGHSLGGYLATAFTRLFGANVQSVNTYNSAGFSNVAASNTQNSFDQIAQLIGNDLGRGSLDAVAALQTNYYAANGWSVTTNTWGEIGFLVPGFNQYGNRIALYQEDGLNGSPINNHSMYKQTDLLALGSALERLDPSFTFGKLNAMVKSGSNDMAGSYEGVLDGLRKILMGSAAANTPTSDDMGAPERSQFHANLKALTDLFAELNGAMKSLAGKLTLSLPSSTLSATAKTDFGAFLSLSALSPVVISTADAAALAALKQANAEWAADWTTDNNARLYGDTSKVFAFTDNWYSDRSAMLNAVLVRNQDDTTGMLSPDPVHGVVAGHYQDLVSGADIQVGSNTATTTQIIFGGNGADSLMGATAADHIYGGAGDDALNGLGGNDYLEGGSGIDTYIYQTGGGSDTIVDSDHQGRIQFDDNVLSGGTRAPGSQGAYTSRDGLYSFVVAGGDLSINSSITVKGFKNKDLGIYLDDSDDPQTPPKPPTYNPKNAIRRWDPLALDMNGNGQIDTISSTQSSIYFDFNGDAISERAGWVAPQDGLLALDVNGNGAIDGLTELFGSNQQDGFSELAQHDGNHDTKIDEQDADFAKLRVWQDSNQDGISQASELKSLTAAGITAINLITTAAHLEQGDNIVSAIGTLVRNGQTQLAADVDLAINFALTDSNPNRPLDLAEQLDTYVYALPWLRGYGDIRSLHVAYQEQPNLASTARALIAGGFQGIVTGFDNFLTQWSGLAQAHAAHGVTRTELTTEDKAWILERFTGQDVQRSAIETANFGTISPSFQSNWNTTYIDTSWNTFVQHESISFAVQTAMTEWLSGASYSLSRDQFIINDSNLLQQSLVAHVASLSDTLDSMQEAALSAVALSRLLLDGANIDTSTIKQGLAGTLFEGLISRVLDNTTGQLFGWDSTGTLTLDTGHGVFGLGVNGNNTLTGGSSSDILIGGTGNDTLSGQAGNDIYLFNLGDGQDTIYEYDGTVGNIDTLSFGSGIAEADIRLTRSGDDLLLSITDTADQVRIQNWGSSEGCRIEKIQFSNHIAWDTAELQARVNAALSIPVLGTTGTDVLKAWYDENAYLQGLAGDDYLFGNSGNDTLNGGTGNDQLQGGTGSDTYLFNLGDGQDTISEYDGTIGNIDTVRFGTGIAESDIRISRSVNDLILNINGTTDQLRIQNWGSGDSYRIEQIEFANGAIWDRAQLQAAVSVLPIMGTAIADRIFGDALTNTLVGGMGDDYLQGNFGNDTLDGGIGNDQLQGGSGNDTYLFNLGDGQDTIFEFDGTLGNIDTMRFGTGIAEADISLSRSVNDLILSINGTTDQVRILNWGSGDSYRIEQIQFANGVTWDKAQLQTLVSGCPILGTGTTDRLYGDSLANTLVGGKGDDYLQGGAGNDTYLFNLGDGQDTISEYDETVGNIDTVLFGIGIVEADVRLTRSNGDLLLSINGTSDQVRIQSWGLSGYCRMEKIQFANGAVWNAADLQTRIDASISNPVMGTDGADSLYAWYDENAYLQGLAGDDYLLGNAGSDTLNGGIGNDNLRGGAGNDTYLFNLGDGQDTISEYDGTIGNIDTVRFGTGIADADIRFTKSGSDLVLSITGTTDRISIENWGRDDSNRIEQIQFANGTTWDKAYLQIQWSGIPIVGTANADNLYGDNLANTLVGGKGEDYLQGGFGNDTYVFNLGDGQDTIIEYDGTVGNIDTVQFGAGIAATDISLSRSVDDLILSINGSTDQVRIRNWGLDDVYRIEQIQFANGVTWDRAQLQTLVSSLPILGTATADNLNGDALANTLIGGKGDDYLQGGAGNDTYVFNLGDGQDTIFEVDGTVGNIDTLRFGAGIAATDIVFSRSGNDLLLSINGTTDQVRIQNWGSDDVFRIEQIQFTNGTSWDKAYLQTHWSGIPIVGTTNADVLLGDEFANVLNGGTGNDSMYGGAGNDTYLFNLGDGQDTIIEQDGATGSIDTLRFGSGIVEANISLSRSGNDLVLSINGTTDQVSIQNWANGDYYRIEQVQFADGTTWGSAQLQSSWSSIPIVGTAAADYLSGDDFANTLIGGKGDDTLQGRAGDDTYLFNLGDGQDTIIEYDATIGNTDTLRFGAGILSGDISLVRSVNDLVLRINGTSDQVRIQDWGNGDYSRIEAVQFADGTLWNKAQLSARFLIAPIMGTPNNDTLNGDDFANILSGGAGNDYLRGGAGNDTYLFNLGDGQDTIVEQDATAGNVDTLRFGAGIAAGDIRFSRDGQNLVLSVNGTADQVCVENWANGNYFRIEQVQFADGTTWDALYMQQQLSASPLVGTAQDDTLSGDALANTLIGNAGNDYLLGGAGNDTYLFNLGDGQDTILDLDEAAGNLDTLRFGAGIAAADIRFGRNGPNLVLSVNGTGDQVQVKNWGDSYVFHLENVQFADGTIWNAQYLQQHLSAVPFVGTSSDDTLTGDEQANTLVGNGGNDRLIGGEGNDTYLFNLGDGQDTIAEQGNIAGNVDTLQFGQGISASDIGFVRSGVDLVLKINGTSDQVVVENWGLDGSYRIENVLFADGTVWDLAQLQSHIKAALGSAITGTAENDSLYAWQGYDEHLQGFAGDDVLDGNDGNDLLDGGAGNDQLYGGPGSDTFLFGLGSGKDVIVRGYETGDTPKKDVVLLAQGIAPGEVRLRRGIDAPDNLTLLLPGDSDQLLITNYFNHSDYAATAIDEVRFADGTVWDTSAILSMEKTGGTDQNDVIFGSDGNDTLDGGAGSDMLYGGLGNDVYLFGPGSGVDSIWDTDTSPGNVDTVRLSAGVLPSEVTLSRSKDNLILSLIGCPEQLTLMRWFSAKETQIEAIAFADGTVWDAQAINAQLPTVRVTGTAGDDILYGTKANALFEGGTGNDVLMGGGESDTYLFNLGDGQDTISENGNELDFVDAIRFGAGIAADDISASREGTSLLVKFGGPGNAATDQITVVNWDTPQSRIEQIQFADGTVENDAWLDSLLTAAPTGANKLVTLDEDTSYTLHAADFGFSSRNFSNYLNAVRMDSLPMVGSLKLSGTVVAASQLISTSDLAAGNLVFTPVANANGSNYAAFSFSVRDQNGGFDTTANSITFGVTPVNDAPTGSVTVGGTTTQNQTLTAAITLADVDGLGPLSYQWQSSTNGTTWTSINAAIASTFTLTSAQVGAQVRVQVSYTDGQGTAEKVASSATVAVAAAINQVTGTAGADTLVGTTGADRMQGLAGNDIYVVNNAGDIVIEALNAGTDLVQSGITYALTDNVESLTLTGTTAINATGNGLANTLTGNAGNNILDGGLGADTMAGGAGNDTYYVDNTADVTTEAANAGTDIVMSAITWTLGTNLENLTLLGTAAINGTGNALANVLVGNAGNNVLNGGAGNDTMVGGLGDDTYVLDVATDIVTENLNEGTDTVQIGVTYALGANIENLTLTGTAAINATGNALANTLTGNAGINVLDGGAGADTMVGGAGNDTYYVDNAADVTTEAASAGTDTVRSSITWTLGTDLENLTLLGTAAINVTGNTVANVLTGNAGDNVLNGGTGADTMLGGLGNDTYVLDVTTDVVTENLNEGTDTVQIGLTYTLGANLENLTLTGSTAVNGTGNSADNVLLGNSAANTLTGNAGNDTLNGGAGADNLLGGIGNDTYWLGRGYGLDTITENDTTAGNTDMARFDTGIAVDQLWFTHTGNNLDVSIIGTADKFTVKNWYLGSQYHVEQFKTSDGKTLLDSQVQNLVSAMAAFAPPAAGQTTLSGSMATTLAPVIAANWR